MTEQGENAGTFGWGLPEQKGLYDPALEKDACGVGFMVQVKGIPSHSIVQFGNTVLCKLSSRGAVGADPRDGDGAGLMCAVPHKFLERVLREQGTMLPEKGSYACGNIFLSPDESVRSHSFAEFEKILSELELKNLAWRQVPVDSSVLGPMSKSKEPLIYQPFIVPNKPMDAATFKKTLYVLRKRAMHAIGLPKSFYICSLNTQTIVYKGQLTPAQVYSYFPDIGHDDFESHFALVHSRFSTNTFPSWDRAQPMRWLAHNGEINTLGGNINWMKAREGILESHVFDDLSSLFPIIEPFGSDSATFDNVLELIIENGVLSLPEAIMMMVPEAWQNNPYMDEKKKAWYQWASCIMEPWDGPALFTFADGRYCGACLDRNGLRPCRYWLTDDDIMICASEVGTLDIDPPKIQKKGRLMPGRILLVDTQEGRVVEDEEIKSNAASRHNFSKTISEKLFTIDQVVERVQSSGSSVFTHETLRQIDRRMHVYGFSVEQLNLLIIPMLSGMEGLGSMGHDGALACVSTEPRVIYEYFRQLFAQVTNPPIDPLREELIMSLQCYVGPGGNLLELQPDLQCAKLSLPSPMLSSIQMHAVHNVHLYDPQWRSCSIDITFPREEGEEGYVKALDRICREGQNSVEEGHRIIVLSDRNTSFQRVPLSTLVACGAVHHHLVDLKQRLKVVLVVETAEAREVHHMCVLLGYGADAICPYLVHDLIGKLHRDNAVPALNMSAEQMIYNYSDACDHGILKVMSKMGISTLQSYKGAQIFEALGLDDTVVKRCFKGTATRIRGSTFYTLARDALAFHEYGYPTLEDQSIEPTNTPDKTAYNLREAGEYHYRIGGESHMNTPGGVVNLQDAVRTKNIESYRAYSREMQEQTNKCALRGMLDIAYEKRDPIPVEEVEDWTSIVKRFVTGAMSYGSISEEAHSALAIAMNRIGTKSNTGEGGEDSETSVRGGDSRRSSTKQVASGRFGVTGYYLTNAEELQIKLAQGAKPGEGGELPGHKVSESIAKTRKSTAGVGLISPPPHHDIYSIEDLKQLIYDLKCSNPRARISVKLVSEVGIGVISAGVAKAKAEHILISGHDGGTGAARWTGIKHAGLPWELGLAETHQTLVLNNLRNKVVLQTDGQIRTGLDVAVACLLGAEEWGFATTPLIALGCIMMRKCHLNTCPVGVATQDPELRKKFVGQPEHVINFFYYVAEELRDIMAKLGFRKITDMVGRSDLLKFRGDEKNPKMSNIDFTKMLHLTPFQFSAKIPQNFNLDLRIENQWMDEMMKAVDGNDHVRIEAKVSNTDRTLGATISSKIHAKFREEGMTKGSIHIKCNGSAGQSFGAFLAKGVTLELEGDANDYVGKGLSGGRVIIFPPKTSKFIAEENVIVGNVCFYGATSGRAYVRGIAAERFAVRNSGAEALVEGVGEHGCEYMTGGRVIILGKCGRNFGAGMSGGIAYVWDPEGTFPRQVNRDLVQLETMEDPEEIDYVKKFLEEHHQLTGSEVAGRLLAEWTKTLGQFVVVMPRDYKAVMEKQKKQKQVPQAGEIKELSNGHPKAHSNGHSNGNSNGIPPKNQIQKDTAEKIADLEDIVTDEEVAKKQLDKIRGFMKYKHKHDKYRRAKERSEDWKEISYRIDERELKTQTARCMDCGIPFCQSDYGCPIANIIPSWNELVFQDKWREAYERLALTNNFPEFTGRVCPAPCEGACVLGLIEKPVAIKSIECAIIDKAFDMGWVVPSVPKVRNGLRIAIIGSGPAGLAAADQLNRGGYRVTVYERSDRPGGLLTYGIPEMKLEKRVVDRRIDVMKGEGIEFRCNANVGHNVDALQLLSEYDSLLLATGATWPRDLDIPGRNSKGIHFAMDYLHQNTFSLLNSQLKDENFIDAKGKHVIVIGGGDTGNDCIGTAVRHGAASVINFDYHERLPEERGEDNAWPQWPRIFRVEYGHAEVVEKYSRDPREFCAKTKSFVVDESGHVTGINTVQVEWYRDENRKWRQREKAGTDRHWKADLVLLAMGYSGPETKILEDLAVKIDRPTGNAPTALARTPQTSYATNVPKVYAAGDCRRGQSLVVWGIREGREAAREIDENLTGSSLLPVTGGARATLYKKRAVAQ